MAIVENSVTSHKPIYSPGLFTGSNRTVWAKLRTKLMEYDEINK